MTQTATAVVSSPIRKKHWTQSEHREEFLNIEPGGK